MLKKFKDLSEKEILALAIASEEEDGRIYGEFADALRETFPSTATMFEEMREEEAQHRDRLLEMFRQRFGDHIPLIRRENVKGFLARRPNWLIRPLGVNVARRQAEVMELEAQRFYQRAIARTTDTSTRALLNKLADEERKHIQTAGNLEEKHLTADAKEVERGLKTENRIGPRAYLSPGAAFAGGTLARDVAYLNRTARERGVITPLLSSVLASNDSHKHWAQRKLRGLFVDLSGATVAVWGLTYKPGTDTLRRSASVELCDWMIREGATIHVHDPMVKSLPEHWCDAVKRYDDPIAAVLGAHALVVATEWPIYRTISTDQLIERSPHLVVLDANRFLTNLAAAEGRVRYFAVGMPP